MDGFLKKISENLKMRFTALKNYRLLVVLGIIGMILILMSELISSGEQQKDTNEKLYKRSEYEEYMERQVEKILGKMEGVGKVNVMLTVEGTEEYVYAVESKENSSSSSENSSSQSETNCVFQQKGGDKEALVKKIINPSITGVVVVCDGGDDLQVKEKIYEAVSVSLNIPVNRICIAGT